LLIKKKSLFFTPLKMIANYTTTSTTTTTGIKHGGR